MVLPILTYPNPLLKKKTETIEDPKSPEIKELIFDMLETLKDANGMGLAAPQVGKSVRLCVIKCDRKTYILINPKIKSKSLRKETLEEGCLSFPGEYIPIKRHKKVKVTAFDRHGKKIEIKAEGILSRALQHEIDHLDGVLFIERANKKDALKMIEKENNKI
jgi:peptide deformylase